MNNFIGLLLEKFDEKQIRYSMKENNCNLSITKELSPNVIFRFDNSLVHERGNEGVNRKIPDYIFAENKFDGCGCLVLVELSIGGKNLRTIHGQLQSGYRIIERMFENLNEQDMQILQKVKKFAVYCGNYDKYTHRQMKLKASMKGGKGKKNRGSEMESIEFFNESVEYRKCKCGDSISVINTITK